MKTIRRTILAVFAAVLLLFLPQRAESQGVAIVQDPTHIGVATSNAASQLEETINLLAEMLNLKDIEAVANGLDKLSDIVRRLNDAGIMIELAEQYAQSIDYTMQCIKQIQEWDSETSISEYNQVLRQIVELEQRITNVYTSLINYIKSLKTSDAEKAAETRRAVEEMKKTRLEIQSIFGEVRSLTLTSRSAAGMLEYLDMVNSVDAYVSAYRSYGTTGSALRGWAAFVRILALIVFIVLIAIGVIIFFRGNATGMSVSNTAMIRIFMGALIVFMFLSIFAELITIM